MLTGGGLFDEALVTELERELGISIKSETMGNGYFDRLNNDPPQIWSLSWIAAPVAVSTCSCRCSAASTC